jgi:RND family efflux transporter MFP subunit
MRESTRLTAALAALPAVLALTACHREKKPALAEPAPVRVEAVRAAGAGSGARYSASIQPQQQVNLAFKSAGYVREVAKVRGADGRPRNVQQGDFVRQGTVLARVRETDYVQKVDQAKASLAEAAASFEKQRLDFDRSKALFQSKSIAKSELDGAQASFESARARVEGSKAQLDAAQTALADCALAAPMDSVILSRSIEEGSLAGSGTVGFTLADTSSVKVVFGVPDVVRDLRIGQVLPVAVEAVPGARLSGRITALSPSADPQSRVFDVEITIPNPGGRLRSGMIASVETPREGGAAISAKTAVPLTAVVKSSADPGEYAVFVVADDSGKTVVRMRGVKLGEIVGNRIAVTSGLSPGERVIVTGTTIVSDGDPVRVIP